EEGHPEGMSDEEEDILEGYTSEESDLARALSGVGMEEESLLSSETEAEVTVVENCKNVPDDLTNKPPPHNEDHVAAAIESPDGPLRICSAYMGHDQEALPPHPLIKQLVEDSRKHEIDLIIGCDANAHHHQWGSTDTNERGESIFDFILDSYLLVGNRGTEPTFIVKNRREVLDVTLYSESLVDRIVSWRVLEKHSFSDHQYIELVVNFENFNRQTVRNPRKANWELYRKKLYSSLARPPKGDVDSREALDAMVDTFTAACARAFNKACPKSRSGNSKSKKPPWWSPTLAPFKTKSRKAFNFARKTNSETAWESYKADLRQYNKELRKAKRNAWAKFCSNIQKTSEASRLRKVFATTAPNVGYIKTSEGNWTSSSKETLEALIRTYFPGCSREDTTLEMQTQGNSPSTANQLEYLLSDRYLSWAINSFKPFKSPGPDGIVPAQLIKAGPNLRSWLKKVFSAIFRIGIVPA
ncbi:hypothetical protein KR026_000097, partial [Drosophila bipectinata]